MSPPKVITALVVMCVFAAQPCAAAHYSSGAPGAETRTSAFVGFNVRMALGAAAKTKPTARLQLTSAFNVRDARTGSTQTFKGHGLEIGAAKSGQPALYLNGRNTTDIKAKLGMSGTTKTVLILGGVLVALVVVVAAAASSGLGDTCPEFEGSRDHCIDP